MKFIVVQGLRAKTAKSLPEAEAGETEGSRKRVNTLLSLPVMWAECDFCMWSLASPRRKDISLQSLQSRISEVVSTWRTTSQALATAQSSFNNWETIKFPAQELGGK